jgi:hypothetical protein
LPMNPSQLIKEADALKLDPMSYAARKFNYDGKRQEQEQKRQADHDREIADKAIAENDRKWAERVGSNPDVRMSMQSPKMTDIARATRSGAALPGAPGGKLNDPLMLNESERRAQTRAGIRSELSEQ